MNADLGWSELAEEIQEIDDEVDTEFECVPSNSDLLDQALEGDADFAEKLLEMNTRVLNELATLFHDKDWWFADEARKITTRAASTAPDVLPNHDMDCNPTMAHRQQTRGNSDSDSTDSHVLTYIEHLQKLICWTSALEVSAAIFPAAKSIKQYTHLIGNQHVDLANYPSGYSPDYIAPTLLLAARLHGYRGDSEQLFVMLDNNVNGACRTNFQKFFRPVMSDQTMLDSKLVSASAHQIVVDEINGLCLPSDLTLRMQMLDPGCKVYKRCKEIAEGCLAVWKNDQMFDDMVLESANLGYMNALTHYRPDNISGASFYTYVYRCVVNVGTREALKHNKYYVTGEGIDWEISEIERKLDHTYVSEAKRSLLSHELVFLKKARSRNFLIISTSSLDDQLTDADGSGSKMDALTMNHSASDASWSDPAETDAAASRGEASAVLEMLLSQLTARERQVVSMRYLVAGPLSWHEVASTLLVTPDTAKSAHQQAMTKMRDGAAKMGVSLADLM